MANPERTTSLDKAELHNWRFGQNNGFVVKDYTGLDERAEPVIAVLKSEDIFEYINDASANKRKVCIYAIGPCVLDWS